MHHSNINALCGLPRSGSTLICNLLNQRKDTHASSTSGLGALLTNLSVTLADLAEVKSDHLHDDQWATSRQVAAMRAFALQWYESEPRPNVIDKGRGWAGQALLLRTIFPDSKIIVTVRDPRAVLASAERSHRESASFAAPEGNLLLDRCRDLMSSEGIVGSSCRVVEDLIRRDLPGVLFVKYEDFVAEPGEHLEEIAGLLRIPLFEHDLEKVEGTSTDADAMYMGKWPHDGSGPVKGRGSDWSEFIPEDIAVATVGAWPLFSSTFGYE